MKSYKIIKKIGVYSEVYKCIDKCDKVYAMKVYKKIILMKMQEKVKLKY